MCRGQARTEAVESMIELVRDAVQEVRRSRQKDETRRLKTMRSCSRSGSRIFYVDAAGESIFALKREADLSDDEILSAPNDREACATTTTQPPLMRRAAAC